MPRFSGRLSPSVLRWPSGYTASPVCGLAASWPSIQALKRCARGARRQPGARGPTAAASWHCRPAAQGLGAPPAAPRRLHLVPPVSPLPCPPPTAQPLAPTRGRRPPPSPGHTQPPPAAQPWAPTRGRRPPPSPGHPHAAAAKPWTTTHAAAAHLLVRDGPALEQDDGAQHLEGADEGGEGRQHHQAAGGAGGVRVVRGGAGCEAAAGCVCWAGSRLLVRLAASRLRAPAACCARPRAPPLPAADNQPRARPCPCCLPRTGS